MARLQASERALFFREFCYLKLNQTCYKCRSDERRKAMQNENFNESQQKVNLRVSVHQKDGHRVNSQKNPRLATRGKNVAEWSQYDGTECSFN